MVSLHPSRTQGAETAVVSRTETPPKRQPSSSARRFEAGPARCLLRGANVLRRRLTGGRSGLTRSLSWGLSRKSAVIECRAPAPPARSFRARCLGPARGRPAARISGLLASDGGDPSPATSCGSHCVLGSGRARQGRGSSRCHRSGPRPELPRGGAGPPRAPAPAPAPTARRPARAPYTPFLQEWRLSP